MRVSFFSLSLSLFSFFLPGLGAESLSLSLSARLPAWPARLAGWLAGWLAGCLPLSVRVWCLLSVHLSSSRAQTSCHRPPPRLSVSVRVSVCLSVRLSVCPCVCLAGCLSSYLSVCLSVCLSLFVRLSLSVSRCLSLSLPLCLSATCCYTYCVVLCIKRCTKDSIQARRRNSQHARQGAHDAPENWSPQRQ